MKRMTTRSFRRACAGAALATAGLFGGAQQADASIAIGHDHGLTATISPNTNLGTTYVAAFYGFGGSGGFGEVFKVADSIANGDDFTFVVNLDDIAFDYFGFGGFAVLSTYADGVVISFDPVDATDLINNSITFDDLTFSGLSEAEVEFDINTMSDSDVLFYAEEGYAFSWTHPIGNNDTLGDQDLVGFTSATDQGDVTNAALVNIPEPVSAMVLALGGGCLAMRRRRG